MARQAADPVAQRIEDMERQSFQRCWERCGWQAQDRARRNRCPLGRAPRPHERRGAPFRIGQHGRDTSPRATLNAIRGLHVSSQGSNVCQLSLLCSIRCARCHTDRPGGAMVTSVRAPTSAARRADLGSRPPARCRRRSRTRRWRRAAGSGSRRERRLNSTCPTLRSRRVPREPAARVRAWRLHGDSGEVDPSVGRPDAVQAGEARRARARSRRCRCRARSRMRRRRRRKPSRSRNRRARGRARPG